MTPTTIGDLERAAGVTDREAFWMPFATVRGTVLVNGRACDAALEAGIAELRRRATDRAQASARGAGRDRRTAPKVRKALCPGRAGAP